MTTVRSQAKTRLGRAPSGLGLLALGCPALCSAALSCTAPGAAEEEQPAGGQAPTLLAPAPVAATTVAALLPPPPRPNRCSAEPATFDAATVPSPEVRGVLLVSIDGLATRHVEDLMARAMVPTFARLIQEGASTYNARTEARITVTLPNHTSMLSGRPAVAVPGLPSDTNHGVVYNDDPEDTAVLHGENPDLPYVTSVFDEVHDRGGFTAMFTGKDKFAVFQRSYSAPFGRADLIDVDDGPDKIDDFSVVFDASELVPELLASLEAGAAAKPDVPLFALFHFRDTDALGHASGWDSPQYVGALSRVDGLLGQILDHIVQTPVLSQLAVIVTTDHGGFELTHDDITDPRIYRIPFFVWGTAVPQGVDLYQASLGSRVDPGEAAPEDGTATQPIRNGDAANFALWMMGLPPIEGTLHQGMRLGMPPCETAAPAGTSPAPASSDAGP